MEAGRELDALIAEKVMEIASRISWEILNADETASCYTIESKGQAERYLAGVLREFPNSWMKDYHVGTWKHYLSYSTDIAAAWQVVERMKKDWHIGIMYNSDAGEWYCAMENRDHFIAEQAVTVSLAICLAALKVVEVKDATKEYS